VRATPSTLQFLFFVEPHEFLDTGLFCKETRVSRALSDAIGMETNATTYKLASVVMLIRKNVNLSVGSDDSYLAMIGQVHVHVQLRMPTLELIKQRLIGTQKL
jgi:hypothetical protein